MRLAGSFSLLNTATDSHPDYETDSEQDAASGAESNAEFDAGPDDVHGTEPHIYRTELDHEQAELDTECMNVQYILGHCKSMNVHNLLTLFLDFIHKILIKIKTEQTT